MKIKKIYQGELPENKILNTQSTSQTDTYSCEYINNLGVGGGSTGATELNYISLYMTQPSQTFTAFGHFQFTMDNIQAQFGNKLTHDGSKIIVGAGVNHVRMSGQVDITYQNKRSGSNTLEAGVAYYINGTNCTVSMRNIKDGTTENHVITIPTMIFEVKEGDIISLGCYSSSQNVSRYASRAIFTVEVVD